MKFLDQAKIYCRSGDGGDGVVAFRREKFIEFGGPDGGNGGRGGDIVFEAAQNLNTLIDFRYTQHFRAHEGRQRRGSDRTGAAGAPDVVIKVPVGTQILDDDRETLLADLDAPGKRVLLLRGGDGGYGNAHFKTSHQPRAAPGRQGLAGRGALGLAAAEADRRCRAGRAAECRQIDVPVGGLGGAAEDRRLPVHHAAPAAGRGAAVRPPQEFVLADIPGLIEGAHEGAGLGDRFLGHVERCAVLLHLVDGAAGDVVRAWRTVREELAELWRRARRQAGDHRAEQGRRHDPARGVSARRPRCAKASGAAGAC